MLGASSVGLNVRIPAKRKRVEGRKGQLLSIWMKRKQPKFAPPLNSRVICPGAYVFSVI